MLLPGAGYVLHQVNAHLWMLTWCGGAASWYRHEEYDENYIEVWRDLVTDRKEYGGRAFEKRIAMTSEPSEQAFILTIKRYLAHQN